MEERSQSLTGDKPLAGLNHSVYHQGLEIHVQTEDLGNTERRVKTQVFCSGRVIISRTVEYPERTEQPEKPGLVIEIMRRQHFEILRELEYQLRRQH